MSMNKFGPLVLEISERKIILAESHLDTYTYKDVTLDIVVTNSSGLYELDWCALL